MRNVFECRLLSQISTDNWASFDALLLKMVLKVIPCRSIFTKHRKTKPSGVGIGRSLHRNQYLTFNQRCAGIDPSLGNFYSSKIEAFQFFKLVETKGRIDFCRSHVESRINKKKSWINLRVLI